MNRRIEFELKCNPPKTTKQTNNRILRRPDGTQFVGSMDSRKYAAVKHDLMLLLSEHVPDTPMTGPLLLSVVWAYPWRKSEPKRNRAAGYRWCDTRPECDNLCKGFQDVMTRLLYWHDDSQVARLIWAKLWSDDPGIRVIVEELAND